MTAEVAIINSNGVALAADSAVTVGGKKIYNSALKLFALSKTEPVGIMIYGNADLMTVPWETLIKLFRKNIDNKYYDHLTNYGDKFIEYLNKNSQFFSDKEQNNWLINQAMFWYKDMLDEVDRKISEEAIHGYEVDESSKTNLMIANIDRYYDVLSSRPITLDIQPKSVKKLKMKIKTSVKDIVEYLFNDFKLPKKSINLLFEVAVLCVHEHTFKRSSSGIVIAGFGESEIYPSIITYEIEGVYD
ncbi:hypothetical protein OHW41_18420, partial [Acinetobacter baumannii]|nr:hypothetical protein [Acinetobacter baumannii]